MKMDLPEGWKRKSLDEILTAEQIRMVCSIVERTHSLSRMGDLRKYLNTIKDDLKSNEVDPDYLAYFLFHRLCTENRG